MLYSIYLCSSGGAISSILSIVSSYNIILEDFLSSLEIHGTPLVINIVAGVEDPQRGQKGLQSGAPCSRNRSFSITSMSASKLTMAV